MGDCSDICGCRPDDGHGPSGRTTVRHGPSGRMSAASNSHIRLPGVRTMGDERPDS